MGAFRFDLFRSIGAKSIADFGLRIAEWNIGLARCFKSAIRNLHSEILFTPTLQYSILPILWTIIRLADYIHAFRSAVKKQIHNRQMRLKIFKQLWINRMVKFLNNQFKSIFFKAFQIHVIRPALTCQVCICSQGFAYIDEPVGRFLSEL